MPSSAGKVTSNQIERMIDLQARCWTITAIAKEVGLHRKTVERHLLKINGEAMKGMLSRLAEIKAKQIAQLERISTVAIAEYERSRKDARTVKTTVEGGAGEGEGTVPAAFSKKETTRKGRVGEAALLAQARGALSDIRDILGLDAPKQSEFSGVVEGDGAGVVIYLPDNGRDDSLTEVPDEDESADTAEEEDSEEETEGDDSAGE